MVDKTWEFEKLTTSEIGHLRQELLDESKAAWSNTGLSRNERKKIIGNAQSKLEALGRELDFREESGIL